MRACIQFLKSLKKWGPALVAKCSSKVCCLAPVATYISAGAYAPVLPTLPLPLIKWYYIIDTRKIQTVQIF